MKRKKTIEKGEMEKQRTTNLITRELGHKRKIKYFINFQTDKNFHTVTLYKKRRGKEERYQERVSNEKKRQKTITFSTVSTAGRGGS
jgi:hypothetical protein